ncbi:MAG: DUF4402 domain-containing protein [Micavibrio aeruginosavorus]|uniref:DUF4402 domain-containing protein n=1 Tax=Micavibrio aeruginosavorus TaxID=349221 RepID=A0A7T5R3R7_9BACT|nr:MAG: DUF4402 domain-containing protein [Micavibrio aeruginosavorus]
MTKRILLTTGLAVLALGALGISHQARAVSDTGDIEATIVQPITFTAVDTLDFGNIAAPTAGTNTVVIAPNTGARTLAGGGDGLLIAGGGEQDGTFNLDGEDTLTVDIDVPADGTVTVTSGANTMNVDVFTWAYDGGGATTGDGSVALAVGGPDVLSVGATLSVGTAQAAGTYTGTYTVDVTYQ